MYDLTNHRVHNDPETDGLTDYVDVRRCQDTACSAQRGSDLRKKGKGKKEKGKEKKKKKGKGEKKKREGEREEKKGKGKRKKEERNKSKGPHVTRLPWPPPRRGGQLCSATKNLKYPLLSVDGGT